MKERYMVQCRRTKVKGLLIGIYQFSEVLEPSPLRGGHRGGQSSYPIALIETEGGFVHRKVMELDKIGIHKGVDYFG